MAQLGPAGPDAIGGIDDWLLSNGTLCAVISDTHHETGMLPFGGALVDLYDCKAGNDQWSFQHFLLNIDKDAPLHTQQVSAMQSEGRAAVQVVAEGFGLRLNSRYSLAAQPARQLLAEHTLERVTPGTAVNLVGLLTLHPHLTLTPYSISTVQPGYSLGLDYASSNTSDIFSLVKSMVPADVHVLVGAPELGRISYGVQLTRVEHISVEGEVQPVPLFQQTADTYSMQGAFSQPPWLGGSGKPGLLEFAQSQLMDLDMGEAIKLNQTLYLGKQADVASVSDQIYTGNTLTGRVGNTAAVIEITTASGQPVTIARPDASGRFSARLPQDLAQVKVAVRLGDESEGRAYTFDVGSSTLDVGELESTAEAVLPINNSLPVRLTFVGQNGTANPDFYATGISARFGEHNSPVMQSANYINFAGIASDPKEIRLPPGQYRVLASRGMAFGVTDTTLELKAGNNAAFTVKPPPQQLSTKGWLAADFHVHSAPSFDSQIAFTERLRSFAAQGGEVLVASEHNVLTDHAPALQQMGLQAALAVIGGVELTGMARTASAPYTNGHMNVFPMAAQPQQFAGGLPLHEGQRLRDLYAALKPQGQLPLFQLNHPRSADPDDIDGNYFDHLQFGQRYTPAQLLNSAANKTLAEKHPQTGRRDLDFDLLETANGADYERFEAVRADWFSLLQQGERLVATANSDSHGYRELVAIPQNFVRYNGDLANFSEQQFLSAVKQGRLFGSSGPLLEVSLMGATAQAGIGETLFEPAHTLQVTVQAASWVPVNELRVFVNGEQVLQRAITAGSTLQLPLALASDSWVVVQVNGVADELYSLLAPGHTPFAFSNPVFLSSVLPAR